MESIGSNSLMALWMKASVEPKYTVQNINYYPAGGTAVAIVALLGTVGSVAHRHLSAESRFRLSGPTIQTRDIRFSRNLSHWHYNLLILLRSKGQHPHRRVHADIICSPARLHTDFDRRQVLCLLSGGVRTLSSQFLQVLESVLGFRTPARHLISDGRMILRETMTKNDPSFLLL